MDNSKDLITSLDVAMAEYYCKNNDFDKDLKHTEILFLRFWMKPREIKLLINI